MTSNEKLEALKRLGAKRRAMPVPVGCFALGSFHGGFYECDFVSPWTISAQNVNAQIAVLLQDWSSSEYLSRTANPVVKSLGHDPNLPTNRNLKKLLAEIGLGFQDIFGTNAFPWIKSGNLSARFSSQALRLAFEELVLPQIEIVKPRVVVILGKQVNDVACDVFDRARNKSLADAIAEPISISAIIYATVAHTGSRMNINRGWDNAVADWKRIGAMSLTQTRQSN